MYQVEALRKYVDNVIRHMDVKPIPTINISTIGTSDSGVPWFSVNIAVDWNVNRFKKEIKNTIADSIEANGYKAIVTANYAPQGLEVI